MSSLRRRAQHRFCECSILISSRTIGCQVHLPSLYFRKMVAATRGRRWNDPRIFLDWSCSPASGWQLLDRASNRRPQSSQSLAISKLQMCFHDVVRDNIGAPRPDQSFPGRIKSGSERSENQRRSIASSPSLRKIHRYQKILCLHLARRKSGVGVERYSGRDLNPRGRH
jgi:hypothetical protein